MKAVRKVLIIKLGYSETLDSEISLTSSLGDVLRTTVVLHHYKSEHVTWLVDEKVYPLLEGNDYIDRILFFNLPSVLQLQSEIFDTVINFEKVPGICAMADSTKAWRRFGFRFNGYTGEAEAYDGSEQIFSLCKSSELKKKHRKPWQEVLLSMVGEKWNEQGYILGYKPKINVDCDIGFNWKVGTKWPNKTWAKDNWLRLEKVINEKTNNTVSWQQGSDDLKIYIDWINSVRLLVTYDSLGLHIALALKKKVIVLYGPTNSNETYLYSRGKIIYPDVGYDCIPCLEPVCSQDIPCMDYISPETVFDNIVDFIPV